MPNLCPDCGSNLDLVGIRHRCLKRTIDDTFSTNRDEQGSKEISQARGQQKKPRAIKARKKVDQTTTKTGIGLIKRGPPFKGQEDQTLTHRKPWVDEGISRRSWYRHRQQQAKQ